MPVILFPPSLYSSGGDVASFSNSDILRKLSTDSNGKLAFNGKTVAENALEVAYSSILSKQNIRDAAIQLPDDCDTSRSITLALQGISTQQGIDWTIDEKTFPELDAIVWDGLGLQFVAQEGDAVLITYYKKI